VTANNDLETGPDLDYFQLQVPWRYLPYRIQRKHQNYSCDGQTLEVAVADAFDRPVGFVLVCTADATVSVASHIVAGGQIVPKQHLVVAMIENGYVNVCMRVVGTAVAYVYPYFARYIYDNLASHDT